MLARLVRTTTIARRWSAPFSVKSFVPEHDKPHARSIIVETVVDDEDDEDDMEEMVVIGPSGTEWGGPQRGGKFKEPTRFGDWERKGRCCDF